LAAGHRHDAIVSFHCEGGAAASHELLSHNHVVLGAASMKSETCFRSQLFMTKPCRRPWEISGPEDDSDKTVFICNRNAPTRGHPRQVRHCRQIRKRIANKEIAYLLKLTSRIAYARQAKIPNRRTTRIAGDKMGMIEFVK
jgi:hypothetical protein